MNKIFEIILRKLPFLKNNFLSPIFILLFFGSGFALIGALISQYIFGYQPCILCIYQRIPFVVIILLSLTALILRKKILINKIIFAICLLAIFINILLAFYHSGVERRVFREYSGCSVKTISLLENIEQLREVLQNNKLAKCDDPQLFILGLTMAQWNFIYCLILLIIAMFYYFKVANKDNNYS